MALELRALLAEDDAVSPVIGVVLIVAITVVLAAVAGTLLFGVVDDAGGPAPTAQFEFETNDGGDGWAGGGDFVNVTHEGGDTVAVANLDVLVGDDEAGVAASDWAEEVSAGDTVSLTDAGTPPAGTVPVGGGIDEGETVRVVWSDPASSDTFVVGDHEVG